MKQTPLDPETQFSELLAQFDEALATASDSSSITTQPFISNLADAELQRRFDRVHHCLQLLEQDRRRQAASSVGSQNAREPTAVPHQIGRFRVIRRLGSGGFGVVFLAEDPVLRRQVAIKLPLASIFQSQELHDRFLRECRAAAMLNHPGIVRVLESGDIQGIPYQVAEFVDGERLSDLLKRQRPTVESAAKMVRSLADAVQHAHDHGVLHRDIKPDNILLQSALGSADSDNLETLDELAGEKRLRSVPALQKNAGTHFVRSGLRKTEIQSHAVPRITDFGLARLADDDSGLSRSGMLVGTPKYMSPEQLHGKMRLQGPPTDIYALGVVLHELLTGSVPFADAEGLQSRIAISSNSVPAFRSRHTGISRDLETICLKCLQLRPLDRYASAGDLRDDLSRYLDGRPTLARPVPTHEQFIRWVTGNRKLAGLLGLLILSVFVVMVQTIRNDHSTREQNKVLSAALSQLTAEKRRADESLTLADKNRVIAEQSESRYRDAAWLAKQGEYSAGMVQASTLWKRGDVALMNQALTPIRTRSENEEDSFEWRYLWDQGQTLRPLAGHSEFVKDLAITSDKEHAYSIGLDNTIRRWHLESAVLEATWKLEGEVRELNAAISQNCRRAVISRTLDRERADEVTVWDLDAGRVLMNRRFASNHVQAVAISNDGGVVLVGGQKRSAENEFIPFIQAWIPDTDQAIDDDLSFRLLQVGDDNVSGHTISSIQFSPDGNGVIIAVFAVFNPAHSQLLRTSLDIVAARDAGVPTSVFGTLVPIRWNRGKIDKLKFSPDGRYLAATLWGDTNWAEVWDLQSGLLVQATEEFLLPIGCIAFDSKGATLGLGVTVSADDSEENSASPNHTSLTSPRSEFRLWDFVVDTTQIVSYSTKRDVVFLKSLSSSGGGNDWIVGEGGGALNVLQPESVLPYQELNGHRPTEVWDLAFSGDGSTVFSVGDDHMLRSWDLLSGVEKSSAGPRSILVSCVAVSPDGQWVAAGGYDDDVVVYDAQSLTPVATLKGHTHDVRALAFSPNGRMLASGGRDKRIRIWNVPQFDLAGTREGHTDAVRALTWTTDGRLISAGSDRRVLIWDSKGRVVGERTEPEGIHSLAFAPAGLRIPAPASSATVAVGNSPSRTATDSEDQNNQRIITVQANEVLALGMNHGTVRLWNLPTDTVFFEAQHHGVEIRSVDFSPDGRTLAVGGSDDAVYLWHVATGRNVLTFDQLGSSIHRVAFSPDGASLLAAMHDGTIRIWHAPTVP
jgi:WD40 repeat protein/serine/threonine protein kinase